MARLPGRRGLNEAERILVRIVRATREYDDCIRDRDWYGCDVASAELTSALEDADEWFGNACAGQKV